MKEELVTLFSSAGVNFEWRSLDTVRGDEAFRELAVVTFGGKCSLSELTPEHHFGGALGWTHVTDGAVIPFSDVDCDRIRAFVSTQLISLPKKDREPAFGRAIARVLSHELFHVFTQTNHHGSGLSKRAYTAADLMADDFRFEWAELHDLENSFVPNHSSRPKDRSSEGRLVYAGTGCVSCHGNQAQGSFRGPSLRAPRRQVDVAALAARLKDKASEMYRSARGVHVLWPSFAKGDVEKLASYLNTLSGQD